MNAEAPNRQFDEGVDQAFPVGPDMDDPVQAAILWRYFSRYRRWILRRVRGMIP